MPRRVEARVRAARAPQPRATGLHCPEVGLRLGVSSLRGFAEKLGGFDEVARGSFSLGVSAANFKHRLRDAGRHAMAGIIEPERIGSGAWVGDRQPGGN